MHSQLFPPACWLLLGIDLVSSVSSALSAAQNGHALQPSDSGREETLSSHLIGEDDFVADLMGVVNTADESASEGSRGDGSPASPYDSYSTGSGSRPGSVGARAPAPCAELSSQERHERELEKCSALKTQRQRWECRMALDAIGPWDGPAMFLQGQDTPFSATTRLVYFKSPIGPGRLAFDDVDFDLWSTVMVGASQGKKLRKNTMMTH